MATLQQSRILRDVSPRALIPIGIGLAALLAIIGTGSSLWMSVAVASLLGMALLHWIGPVGILYIYAALMWLLPRLDVPGTETVIPLHLPLMAGAALLCPACADRLRRYPSSSTQSAAPISPTASTR